MKRKFKIRYPKHYGDPEKAGKKYRPPEKCMVVMSGGGVFFLYNGEPFYPSICRLSDVLPAYDVEWVEEVKP